MLNKHNKHKNSGCPLKTHGLGNDEDQKGVVENIDNRMKQMLHDLYKY